MTEKLSQERDAVSADFPTPRPNPWTARIGLVVVATILVSCFGMLIAASHAAN